MQPLGKIHRLEHAPGTGLATRLVPLARTQEVDTALHQQRHVRLGGRVRPHQMVHGWRDGDGSRGRKTQRREQVIGLTAGQARQEIRARRRDQHRIRPARKFDVAHRRLRGRIPQIAAHAAPGDRLEGGRGDKFARRGAHDDLYLGAALAQTAHEVRALVSGDAAGDA